MAQSLIPSRVKNTGIDLLVAGLLFGGSLVALGILNKKFNLVGRFVSGAGSIGTGIGLGVGTGFRNIPIGLGQAFFGGSQPSTPSGTGQIGITPQIAAQNLRDNLTLGGALDPQSPNYIFRNAAPATPPSAGPQSPPSVPTQSTPIGALPPAQASTPTFNPFDPKTWLPSAFGSGPSSSSVTSINQLTNPRPFSPGPTSIDVSSKSMPQQALIDRFKPSLSIGRAGTISLADAISANLGR